MKKHKKIKHQTLFFSVFVVLCICALSFCRGAKNIPQTETNSADSEKAKTNAAPTQTEQPAAMLRDPFWPIGWKPPKPKKKENKENIVPDSRKNWPELKLKGTMKSSGGYMAIIDGIGMVDSGTTVRIIQDGLIYRWKIISITKEKISAQKLDVKPAAN